MMSFNMKKLKEEGKMQLMKMTEKIEQLKNEIKKRESKIFQLHQAQEEVKHQKNIKPGYSSSFASNEMLQSEVLSLRLISQIV